MKRYFLYTAIGEKYRPHYLTATIALDPMPCLSEIKGRIADKMSETIQARIDTVAILMWQEITQADFDALNY